MIKVNLSLSSNEVSTIPLAVINELARCRPFWKDLKERLSKLPKIPLGKYLATGSPSTPHNNAVKFSEEHKDAKLYVGYFIHRDGVGEPWSIEEHSFCVVNGRVYEITDMGMNNNKDVFYVGIEVPDKKHYANLRYLSYFNRMTYILENSPLAA